MAIVFKDMKTGQILRIDYGQPDFDTYAQKEGLSNWEAIETADEDAKKLLSSGEGDPPAPTAPTLEERVKKLEEAVFKS